MSAVLPADTHIVTDTGHTVAHNNLVDCLSVITGASPGGAVSAVQAVATLLPLSVLGDILYENSTPAPARLPGNTSTTRQFLSQTGTGAISAAPAWTALAGSDIPTSWAVLSAAYTLVANTSAQPLLNASASGAVTLAAGLYFFEGEFDITGLSASSHSLALSFAGTASVSSIKYVVDSNTGGPGTLAAWSSAVVVTTAASTITAAVTTTTAQFRLRGVVRIGTGGTFIPQITQSTNGAAANVTANSWLRFISAASSSSATTQGTWS